MLENKESTGLGKFTAGTVEPIMELATDGFAAISSKRLEELAAAEATLAHIRRAYKISRSFELQAKLSIFFGPSPKDESTPGPFEEETSR